MDIMFDNEPLWKVPDNVETRWASYENPKALKGQGAQANNGRKGAPALSLPAGAQYVLAEEPSGAGVIRRIWATIDNRTPVMLRGLRLDFYWDGAQTPAVSVPLGDFFCCGIGRMSTFSSALFASPEGRSFNCYIPMPFRNGMKMVVTNETDINLGAFFYDVDYTMGDNLDETAMYLHAIYRRENPTVMQKDFEILPKVVGKGKYLGASIGVIVDHKYRSWWGEGEVKAYIDGDDKYPTLAGTGTEDYIGTGWGQGQYALPYQGCHLADHEAGYYNFYRWHIPDPVYFSKDIRVTIQQIGCWDPQSKKHFKESSLEILGTDMKPIDFSDPDAMSPFGLFERQDDWSCVAYFYLNKPENGLPALPELQSRIEGLEEKK